MHPLKTFILLIGSGLCLIMPIKVLSQEPAVVTGRMGSREVQKISFSWWQEGSFIPLSQDNLVSSADSFYFRISIPVGRPVFFYLDGGAEVAVLGLVSAGDSLHIRYRQDSLNITGKGAVINRAMYMAQRLQDKVEAADPVTAARLQLAAAQQVLNRYKDSITPFLYTLLQAHVTGLPAQRLTGALWQLPAAPDSTLEERQVYFYKHKILPYLPQAEVNDITVMSTRFVNYLLQKAEADFFIQHRFECNTKAVYEWIKRRYEGRVRDKLLAQALMQGYAAGNETEDQEWCVKDFLDIAQDSACKHAVVKVYIRTRKGLARGNIAPAFSATDTAGRVFSLQQFLGKVVLLHFYDSKANVLTSLKEIKPCFNDDEVSFLNISNTIVVAGLPGLQLLVNEAGKILSQYDVSRFPALIIIGKDGKIFAVKPPNPATDHGTALTNIIYEALLQ